MSSSRLPFSFLLPFLRSSSQFHDHSVCSLLPSPTHDPLPSSFSLHHLPLLYRDHHLILFSFFHPHPIIWVFGESADGPLLPKTLVERSRTVRHGRSFRRSVAAKDAVAKDKGHKMEVNVAMEVA
ncbi:hypothetical protein Syun_006524 [Stephania yunnanensis]|uniref:Uncharacterized protein n=1 Tax=Stephania yunnanensis TaxID=152371 RepID=A0AAP0KWR8_9MAGN